MKVYLETNFILELALKQKEHHACEELRKLAEQSLVRLFIPAVSFAEAPIAVNNRYKKRMNVHEQVSQEINELSRMQDYTSSKETMKDLSNLLIESADQEKTNLASMWNSLISSVTLIELNQNILQEAINKSHLDLSFQDSFVYASVKCHLQKDSSAVSACFITRNSKDFGIRNADIGRELQGLNCKLLFSFENGFSFIRHTLGVSAHAS